MRKVVFLYLFSTFCAAAFAAKPPKIKVEKVDPDTTNIVQYRTRANHWSLSATFGAGYLDGDQIKPNQRVTPIASQGVMKFNFTVNAEYTFSPIWGMYLEYFYNPYGGNARYQNELEHPDKEYVTSDGFHFRGMNHELGIGVSFNILNMFYNYRSPWQWYLNAGISGNMYKMTYHESYLSGDPAAWPTNHFLGEYQGGLGTAYHQIMTVLREIYSVQCLKTNSTVMTIQCL